MRAVILFCFCLLCLFACKSPLTETVQEDPILKKYPEIDYFLSRNWPEETFNNNAYLKAVKSVKVSAEQRSDGNWQTQGPGNVSGRVATIEIDNVGTIYIGYSKGGIYKSTDDGATYTSLMDDEAFLALSDIEIDPSNNNTIYVGTGDVDISIMFGIGNGVLKSTDAGETWTNIGLVEESIISRVHVDKNDPNLVFASAMGIPGEKSDNKGVYRSADGGLNWEQILFVNDSTGIQDMIVHPDNPDIIYATGWNRIRNNRRSVVAGPDARVYRTRDGGLTWDTLTNGLPEEDFSRVGLAMSGTNPDVIFVNFATASNFHSAYKSEDGGDSWAIIAENGENGLDGNSHGGFAWFFGQMRVNPNNDNDIFILGVRMYRTLDGGASWQNVNGGMHVDHHDLVFDGDRIYVGNDGGAYRAENLSSDWEDIDFNVTGLLYKVGYNLHLPEFYFGGAQDNSMYYGNAEDINDWTSYSGGDGFQPAFHPTNPDIWFTESQNGGIRAVNINTFESFNVRQGIGGRFYWDTPYFVSPHDPNLIFLASDTLFSVTINEVPFEQAGFERLSDQLTDPDAQWTAHSVSTIDQSPIDANILYAGTTDGLVWRTLDYGSTWEQIGEGIPRRFVSKVVASPTEESVVYVCHSGYRDNEYVPHVFRSDDNGTNWTDISSDLPQFAVNDIFVYPNSEDKILFVATDGGVYFTENGGESWDRLGNDMPIIPIWDLDFNVVNNEIVAGSFARGILSFDLEQVNIGDGTYTDDSELEGYDIFPTIVENEFQIRSDRSDIISYQIFNQNGQLMETSNTTANRYVNVVHYNSGIYYVKLVTDQGRKTLQFVKS